MGQISRIAKFQKLEYICDGCAKGMMLPTGNAIRGKGYEHACNAECGRIEIFPIEYPNITECLEPKVSLKTMDICPSCKEGTLWYTGGMALSNPPMFQHQCNKCGRYQMLDNFTPTINYIPAR